MLIILLEHLVQKIILHLLLLKKKIYLFNSKFLPKKTLKMSQKYKLTKKKLYLRFFDGFLLIDKFKMETNNKIKFN